MAEELKACPFCGGEPNLTHSDYVHDDLRPMPVVECRSCSAWVRAGDWNRRAQPIQGGEAVAWLYTGDYLRSTSYGEYRFSGIQVEKWGTYRFVHLEPGRKMNSGKVRNAREIPLYTHPAAQVADGVVVSREVLGWAVDRWHAEVSHRPLHNVHRRSLDDTWRQVIRKLGGDPVDLCGPDHSALIAAAPSPASQKEQG